MRLPPQPLVTAEPSVRTAMKAVWGLTGLAKPMIPLYERGYDLRVLVSSLKATLGIQEITPQNLKVIADSSPSSPTLPALVNALPLPVD